MWCERAVNSARRRLRLIRFLSALELTLPAAAAGLAAASFARMVLAGGPLPPAALLLAVPAAFLLAAATLVLCRVPRSLAASEADRALGLDESLSTALAVREGHAADPLTLSPLLETFAERAARGADLRQIRSAIRPRAPLRAALALPLAALFLVLPLFSGRPPGPMEPPEDTAGRERTALAARRLERRAAAAEASARLKDFPEAAKLAARIRDEAARLAAERPRPSAAVARLDALDREARDAARRFAGLPPRTPDESEAEDLDRLRDLAEALKALESADPASLKPRLTALIDKLAQSGAPEAGSPDALAGEEALRVLEGLREALDRVAESGADGASGNVFRGLIAPEDLERLRRATDAIRKLLRERGLDKQAMEALAREARGYRFLQMTPEEVEERLRAMEELRRLLESGADLTAAAAEAGLSGGGRSSDGVADGLGLGLGLGFGPGGRMSGALTGGAGTGRGGRPPLREDARAARPDFIPGSPTAEGTASLLRTVRTLPSAEDAPGEYRELRAAAAREAEEALRRGEIPLRCRGLVRRYFSDPEEGR